MIRVLVWLMLWSIAVTAPASDSRREQDYALDIQRQQPGGEVVWLTAANQSFLALYTEAEKTDNSEVAIILHDQGGHPDAMPFVHRLRMTLPLHNWASLALQMPIRENGASEADYYSLFDEASARIDAAIEYLLTHGAKRIVIVGYGMGSLMAAHRLAGKPNDVMAFVAISMPLLNDAATSLDLIKKVQMPFLDVYAEFDPSTVTGSVRQRRMAGKDNPVYRQIRMDGEDHGYQQDYDLLVKRVYSWLKATVSGN